MLVGILSWVAFSLLTFYQQLVRVQLVGVEINLTFGIFVTFNMLLASAIVNRAEKWDVNELLWKLFVIGISGLVVIFITDFFYRYFFGDREIGRVIEPFILSLKLYGYILFFSSLVFGFKKLIFYNKSKTKVVLWRIFIAILILSGILIFDNPVQEPVEGATEAKPAMLFKYLRTALIPAFFLVTLVLSAYVNWSAFLTIGKKLRALLLMATLGLLMGAYVNIFPTTLIGHEGEDLLINPMTGKYMILGLLFYFPLIYLAISALIVFFNLFTSSVFEQKSSEIASLQRIAHSIQANFNLDETLRTLLDSALLTSNTEAGWIEKVERDGNEFRFTLGIRENLTMDEIHGLNPVSSISIECLKTNTHLYLRNLRKHKEIRLKRGRFQSLVAIPVITRQHPVAVLFLANELSSPYEDEVIFSLLGLSEHAAVAVENSELLRHSINLERYAEQLKVARQMQERILPKKLPSGNGVIFHAQSETAEEIGGDYFDVVKTAEGKFKVALGDVSGKGTEAAFYMAETKGIFQALVAADHSVKEFIQHANAALCACLKPGTFLTLTYLEIIPEKKEVHMIRAGHCPALYYDSRQKCFSYLDNGTLGLGIKTNKDFLAMIPDPDVIQYTHGDFLVLFTDGIVEARNTHKEEYGYTRLKALAANLAANTPEETAQNILKDAREFTGGKIEDDYTLLVIRFEDNQAIKQS